MLAQYMLNHVGSPNYFNFFIGVAPAGSGGLGFLEKLKDD